MAPADSKIGAGAGRSAAAAGAWAKFLLPTLPGMLAAATLIYCLFVFDAGRQLFRDSDTGWHIRNGEWMLANHVLPRADRYSFSKPGEPWVAWEWGADVVMGAAHRADGLRGLVVLFALAIAALTWMCARLHFAAGGDFLLAALLAAPMVTTASLHWLARPHVFSWLFVAGAVLYAERAPLRFGFAHAAGIALVTAAWANMHGSFFLGPAIALIYAAAHFARPWLWDLDAHTEHMRGRWFLLAALAAGAGSLLNPYGWRLHAHVVSYLWNDELTSRVAEFQSFNFHDPEAAQVALTMALAAAGAVLALSQRKLAHFLLAAMLLWGGLRSARVLPLVALVILPLANGAFAEALRGARRMQPGLRRALDRVLRYSEGLRRIDRSVNGTMFLGGVALVCLLVLRAPAVASRIGFPADRFPTAAAEAVEKLPSDARVFAPDSFGGYLVYRFAGERKVFFDGRSDFYGAAFMKQYLVLRNAQPGWEQIAREYRFTHALVAPDSALNAALQHNGWKTLHKDETAVLLEAR